jgi:uncharacterized Zn finger protein
MLVSQPNAPPFLQTETIQQTDINKYEVKSMTNKNKIYEVTLIDQGLGVCTCPDHEYRLRQCKHIAEVLIRVLGVI